jgi:hypothetical protein
MRLRRSDQPEPDPRRVLDHRRRPRSHRRLWGGGDPELLHDRKRDQILAPVEQLPSPCNWSFLL